MPEGRSPSAANYLNKEKKMRKAKKFLASAMAMCMGAAIALSVAGCGNEVVEMYELPAYKGDSYDLKGNVQFNPDLFYRNDYKQTLPDPFVLDDTGISGYYYIYGTWSYNATFRSKDLVNWEKCGNTLDVFESAEQLNALSQDIWAPEVVYDPDLELNDDEKGGYVMFFSATPKNTSAKFLMYAAVSSSPMGPFKLVDFTDPDSCLGAGNVHSIEPITGLNNIEYKFDDYFAKYLLFNPTEFYQINANTRVGYHTTANNGYISTIDPHPYIDPATGTKYLYFVNNGTTNAISVMEMENWLKPKYDTLTDVIRYSYYTVDDYHNNSNTAEQVPFETCGVNEGPFMYYNSENGIYYLTYSVGGYGDNSYQVAQAVSKSATGPFTKLTEDQNGCFLSGGFQGSEEVSGTGHHSFITSGGQLYVVYHRHDDFVAGGAARNPAIDEIKFIDSVDKDGKPLKVMYANGPSSTVQPMIKGMSEYSNIAEQCTVTGGEIKSGSSLKYLNDGLLSSYDFENETTIKAISETYITKESTFEFDFKGTREIVSVLAYNSKEGKTAFTEIKRIEIDGEDGKTYVISDIAVPESYFKRSGFDNSITYVSPCSAAFAEFKAIKAKKVRVVIDVPEGHDSIGISEIRILGK